MRILTYFVFLLACYGVAGNASEPNHFINKAIWQVAPQKEQAHCFDFDANQEVRCDESQAWDLKLQLRSRRMDFFTNSGKSGLGQGGVYGGIFVHSWASLSQLRSTSAIPAEAFIGDKETSPLNADYRREAFKLRFGAPKMQLNFGWYRFYNQIEGKLNFSYEANPKEGVLLRSGAGDSFARVHLTQIKYADSADYQSQTTWTFEFDVQPASIPILK